MKIRLLFINILLILLMPAVYAQVTIGGDFSPRKGALLDLKGNGNSGKVPNADKGLGLPRVALSSLTSLTVDDDSEGNKYVGLTVYNVAANAELTQGTYCWFGNTWKQVVLVSGPGSNGNLLSSNGDYTYLWTSVSIPTFSFHKPTQTAGFISSKSRTFTYDYWDIVEQDQGNNGAIPKNGLFDADFVYTDKLKVKTGPSVLKYLLVQLTADIHKKTVDNAPSAKGFWEQAKIEILIGSNVIKTYRRVYSTPVGTEANTTVDLFSVVPLMGYALDVGEYDIKVRVSNSYNIFKTNYGAASGYFEFVPFLTTSISDFGFVLYEEE